MPSAKCCHLVQSDSIPADPKIACSQLKKKCLVVVLPVLGAFHGLASSVYTIFNGVPHTSLS